MATLTVNIDKPPIPTGNTLWVDAVNGDDATGATGRQDLPYLTLTAARDAASSGDLINVRPSDYVVDSNLAKNGVNWHLETGVSITLESTSSIDLFGDVGAAMSFEITGNGLIQVDAGDDLISHAISVTDPASSVSVRCLDILNVGTLGGSTFSNPINHEGGILDVVCRDIKCIGQSSGYPVWWKDGALSIRARNIGQYSTGAGGVAVSLTSVDQPTGEAYIDADLIESQSLGSAAIQQGVLFGTPTAGSTAKSWINALQIIGANSPSSSEAIVKSDGGNLYVTAQKITGSWTSNGGNGELYVDVQKVQTYPTDDPTPGIISLSGFKSFVNIGNVADGDNNDTLLAVGGGTQVLNISQFKRDNNGSAISVEGGTLILNNSRIDTSVDSTAFPIVKSGGELVLNACLLVSEATSNSISAPSAQPVRASGSKANTAVDANVTVEGSLQVEASAATTGQVPIATARGTWAWGAIPDASETAKGIIEIATAAEVAALNDTTRAVTSANLKSGALIDVTPTYINYTGGSIASTSTSFADLHASAAFTGLAPGFYIGEFFIGYNAAATTTGARFALNGTVTQDYLSYLIGYSTQSGDRSSAQTQVFDGGAPAPSSIATTGNNAILQFSINVTAAGDIAFRFASEVGGSAITVTSLIGFIRRVS